MENTTETNKGHDAIQTCKTILGSALAEINNARYGRGAQKYTVAASVLLGLRSRISDASREVKASLPRPMSAAWREISAMSSWAVVPCR